MNKKERTKKVALKSGLTQTLTANIVNTVIETIRESLATGESVTIHDFGTLAVKKQKPRGRFNLSTHEVEDAVPREFIKFITSKSLKLQQKNKAQVSN